MVWHCPWRTPFNQVIEDSDLLSSASSLLLSEMYMVLPALLCWHSFFLSWLKVGTNTLNIQYSSSFLPPHMIRVSQAGLWVASVAAMQILNHSLPATPIQGFMLNRRTGWIFLIVKLLDQDYQNPHKYHQCQSSTNPQGSLATNVIKCRSGSCEQTPNDGVVGDKGGVLPVGSVSD